MKRIISLILSASLFLQIGLPASSLITYAQTDDGNIDFGWERTSSLDQSLGMGTSSDSATEALVSWKVGSQTSDYILDYMINEENGPEKVRFTFNRGDDGDNATAILEVLDAKGDSQEKTYRKYDFDQIGEGSRWTEHKSEDGIKINIIESSNSPGGRVRIGNNMDIKFRWKNGKVHFQADRIKHGNITPISLYSGSPEAANKIGTVHVLTGLEEFQVSPVHLEVDEEKNITSKGDITALEDRPGSKPGIKINFKRPKKWDNGKLATLTTDAAVSLVATLEIEDLADTAKAQFSFNLGNKAQVNDLDKEMKYDPDAELYTLYLSKADENHPNIVQWESLEQSMTFKSIVLSLGQKSDKEGEKDTPLGRFRPTSGASNRGHTYLGYTIERSSMGEALIKVQPYNGAPGNKYTYSVAYASDGTNWTTIVEHEYISTGAITEESFTIPVKFSPDYKNQYYQVRVKDSRGTMFSQTLYYQPDKDLTVKPPTPTIQSIDNIYAVPPAKLGQQPEAIGFDLTWSAPSNSATDTILSTMLEQGNIYYELFLHDDIESTEERKSLIKVFKIGLNDEDEITVEAHGGTAGKTPARVRYNPSKNTFTMEKVVLKNVGKPGWEQIEIKGAEDKDYTKGTKYPEFTVQDHMTDKEVPGIYYLTMRALYETTESTDSAIMMGISNTSNPQSITISPLEEVIPVPTRMESNPFPDEEDANLIRQTFSWENIDLYRYIKQMLEPLGLTIGGQDEDKGVYEVYLYQNKNLPESAILSTSPSAISLDRTRSYELEEGDLKRLRGGGVVRLDYTGSSSSGMNNILLDGLDANQVYYMKMRVRLNIKNDKDEELEKRYSVFSKQHSFTSYVKPGEPGPGERVPPVPEELQLIDQPNNTTATIGWKAPNYTKQEDEELYYEMVRVDSRVLAKEEDSRLLSIQELLSKGGKDQLHAWRTKGPLLSQYEKNSNQWAQVKPDQLSNKLQLEDDQLSPNEIYYYYVRTVLVVDGEEAYSSWIGLPVTTDPIQKPIMLKVEHEKDYFHDPKREIVISFLAPIPKGANIPGDYDFDIAVQGEVDVDYSTTRLTSKEDTANVPTGYSHFVYKINKVKPGKRYDIRVRTIDKVVDMVNGQYPKSLYSGRVTTRTHFDQDEQDKDNQFEQYLKYFEDQVEALRRRPYWELDEGSNKFSAKYRSNYIIPQINSSKTVQLVAEEGVTDFTYYMPANVIASSNISQTSFEVKQGDVTYSVRPSTITTELQAVKDAVYDINDKYIKDYYIAFNFSQRANRNSRDYLTPEIMVDIELVRLRDEDLILEDDIMIALNEEIADETVRYIEDLERALERGRFLNEDLDRIVNNSLAAIEKRHQKDVRNIIERNRRRTLPIHQWNKSMLIMAMIEGRASAQGYKIGREDTALPTFNINGGYGIEVNEPGIYVFKGQKISIPVIPGIGDTGDLVVKYQLTDFFGVNGSINPNSMARKKDVLGAMARVLGAPRGADYIQHLRQKGMKGITNIGMNQPMRKGEGIYLLMQVYEQIHRKPIASVYIKNRGAVSNLREFNQIHQPYVLVAVDSKLVSQASGMSPNASMLVKDVLEMLDNIMKVIR